MRKEIFTNNQYYHIYNRGVEKRSIFLDKYDFLRFLRGLREFNSVDPIGSIHRNSFNKNLNKKLSDPTAKFQNKIPLVQVVCYCLNSNHYHLILKQVVENGISSFMKKVGGGYACYFNKKYNRVGALFQGRFKVVHIDSNEYLLHLSSYVNLNNMVHTKISTGKNFMFMSSFSEYIEKDNKNSFCEKNIILKQFKNKDDYKDFAEKSLSSILEKRSNSVSVNKLSLLDE